MKKRTVVIIAATLAVVAVALFLVRMAEDKATEDLVSRSNRFSIPAGWSQEKDIVRPVRYLCFDTNPCPSIYRSWTAGREVTASDLSAMVARTGFVMKVDGTCTRKANDIGATTVCSSSGNDGQYDYLVNVTSPDANQPDTAILTIRPHQ